MEKQKYIQELIEKATCNLPFLIEAYTKINQPVEIIDNQLSEVIHAYCHDTLCCGTSGGGWDHLDRGEDKNSSHVQSYVCPNCEQKVVFFATKCPFCGTKDRGRIPHDGRWGINSKTHFKWYKELKEYRLQLIEPMNDLPSCRKFRIRYWVLPKDSVYFNAYAKAQLASAKSDGINFQPLKRDFYLSRPILKFDGILEVKEDHTEFKFNYFNIDNKESEKIPAGLYTGTDPLALIKLKKFEKERGTWRRK